MPSIGPKKLLIAAWIVTFLIVAVLLVTPVGEKLISAGREETVLFALINSAGAELSTIHVTGWVKVDGSSPGDREPAELAGKVAGQMGLHLPVLKTENWQNAYARGAKVEGALPDGSPVSILGQAMEYPKGEKVSHVMVNLTAAEYKKTGFYKKQIISALRQCGPDLHVGVTLSGRINREMDDGELAACAEEMMRSAGATVRERTAKDNLISLTGYSTRMPGNMRYAGREINLNVALRRSPAEHVTYVYVASPVIMTEY